MLRIEIHVVVYTYTVKHAHTVASIKQSSVLKGHHFIVHGMKISYELNLF
jgi:hypothetical protein